jgi:hypothetical protein
VVLSCSDPYGSLRPTPRWSQSRTRRHARARGVAGSAETASGLVRRLIQRENERYGGPRMFSTESAARTPARTRTTGPSPRPRRTQWASETKAAGRPMPSFGHGADAVTSEAAEPPRPEGPWGFNSVSEGGLELLSRAKHLAAC